MNENSKSILNINTEFYTWIPSQFLHYIIIEYFGVFNGFCIKYSMIECQKLFNSHISLIFIMILAHDFNYEIFLPDDALIIIIIIKNGFLSITQILSKWNLFEWRDPSHLTSELSNCSFQQWIIIIINNDFRKVILLQKNNFSLQMERIWFIDGYVNEPFRIISTVIMGMGEENSRRK